MSRGGWSVFRGVTAGVRSMMELILLLVLDETVIVILHLCHVDPMERIRRFQSYLSIVSTVRVLITRIGG